MRLAIEVLLAAPEIVRAIKNIVREVKGEGGVVRPGVLRQGIKEGVKTRKTKQEKA